MVHTWSGWTDGSLLGCRGWEGMLGPKLVTSLASRLAEKLDSRLDLRLAELRGRRLAEKLELLRH